jgi:hypothetical protein
VAIGPDIESDTGSASTKDHSDSNSDWENGNLASAASNTTHDDNGDENDTLDLGDSAGDTDDSGDFGEYTDHSESHSTNDGSSYVYTALSNSSDDGNDYDNVSLAAGGTDTEGDTNHYSDTSQSSTGPNGASTSSYTHDDGGDDEEDDSTSDGSGDSEGGNSSDTYTDHIQGGTNADGTNYSTWTSTGQGNEAFQLNVVAGDDTLSAANHDNYSYTASGGTNTAGLLPTLVTYDENGGDNFSLHLDDVEGDSLDESGTDSFDDEDNNGEVNETTGSTLTFNENLAGQQDPATSPMPNVSLDKARTLTLEKLMILQTTYQSQVTANATLSQAYATAAANFQSISNLNLQFNVGPVQWSSLFINRGRDRLAAHIFKNGANAISQALRESSVEYLNEAARLNQSLGNINAAIAQKILGPN